MLRTNKLEDEVAFTNARADFYARAQDVNLAPLWLVLAGLVTEEPKPQSVPHLWKFADIRNYLMEACDLVTAEEAERRVMVLENPGLPGQSRVSESLVLWLAINSAWRGCPRPPAHGWRYPFHC